MNVVVIESNNGNRAQNSYVLYFKSVLGYESLKTIFHKVFWIC